MTVHAVRSKSIHINTDCTVHTVKTESIHINTHCPVHTVRGESTQINTHSPAHTVRGESEWILPFSSSRVKPAAFDLFLGGCIAAYLGIVYYAIQVCLPLLMLLRLIKSNHIVWLMHVLPCADAKINKRTTQSKQIKPYCLVNSLAN